MISRKIDIWEGYEYSDNGQGGERPALRTYFLDGVQSRPLILICPGGGYQFLSPRVAEPVALQFAAAGFHSCVLDYSVAPRRHPQPLRDVSRAMCLLRESAERYHIDPDRIAVCGFSAGGHLAASLGVHWMGTSLDAVAGISVRMTRPNALILGYPVITSGQFGHTASFANLLGEVPREEELREMSLELQVKYDTPPCFIWHTFADESVPVENSLLFAAALREKRVPFELHIYPEGNHGLSLATLETSDQTHGVDPHVASWMNACIEWLRIVFKFR